MNIEDWLFIHPNMHGMIGANTVTTTLSSQCGGIQLQHFVLLTTPRTVLSPRRARSGLLVRATLSRARLLLLPPWPVCAQAQCGRVTTTTESTTSAARAPAATQLATCAEDAKASVACMQLSYGRLRPATSW